MSALLVNWKTTLAGVATILTASGHLLHALSTGDTSAIATDAPLIMSAIGLLMAQDSSSAK
jgi:hypothetical protein